MTIPAHSISNFKSRLAGGGARANLFEVQIPSLPTGITWSSDSSTDFKFLCKAAALPASNIGSIDVPFRGRTFKVAGDRTVDPWTVTIINDEAFNLRRVFEDWVRLLATLDTNVGRTQPTSYMRNASVFQLGRGNTASSTSTSQDNHSVLAHYQFQDIFPTSVSQIDLSYDSADTIEEFTVEFQVQSYELISTSAAAKS